MKAAQAKLAASARMEKALSGESQVAAQ